MKSVATELVAIARELTGMRMVHKREFYRPNPNFAQNVEEVKVPNDVKDDIEVWRYERDGKLFGVAFTGRAQKPTWQYRFRSEQEMEKTIQNTIANIRSRKKQKQELRDERKKFKHDMVVGTILYSSWGYDQTNINFYEVVEASEKSVIIREIGSRVHHSSTGADYVVAAPGKFSGPKMKKRVRPGNSVRIASYASAYIWDGKPKYETAFGFGH